MKKHLWLVAILIIAMALFAACAPAQEEMCIRDRHHSGQGMPFTLEGALIRYCDRIAYLNHDIDDAIRSGFLSADSLPPRVISVLGSRHSQRINTMVDVYKRQQPPIIKPINFSII